MKRKQFTEFLGTLYHCKSYCPHLNLGPLAGPRDHGGQGCLNFRAYFFRPMSSFYFSALHLSKTSTSSRVFIRCIKRVLAACELLRLFLTYGIEMSLCSGWGKCCFSLWISEGLAIPVASRSVNNFHFCSWITESGLELSTELQRAIQTWSSRFGHSLGTGNGTHAINKVLEVAVSSCVSWNLSLLGRLLLVG